MRNAFGLGPLLFALTLSSSARSAQAPAEKVTRETCAACHDKEAEVFARGAHGQAMSRVPGALDASCVACHGPADAHLNNPEKTNIVRQPAAKACLSCHDKTGNLAITAHAHSRNRVACLDCHASGHSPKSFGPLLRARPQELCASCHGTQARSFGLPYAHRDGTRPFECTACHSLHGQGPAGRVLQMGKGGICVDCHTEKAGPFVYPHPIREVSGCIACHTPHGSTNPRLLTRRPIQAQCLECHTNVPKSHDITKPRYRNCQSCHVAVHGSNHDSKLLDN